VGEYHAGETISLSGAAPDPGWAIWSWTGTDNDGSPAATNVLTMPDNIHTATVNYIQPAGPGTYDDRYMWPGIYYSSNWSQVNYSGPYLGTITQSNMIGDNAFFTFDGGSITLMYTGYVTQGTMDIYIDAVYVTTINQYNPGLAWQMTWTSDPLGAGAHTIIFHHASGANVNIDALIVAPH